MKGNGWSSHEPLPNKYSFYFATPTPHSNKNRLFCHTKVAPFPSNKDCTTFQNLLILYQLFIFAFFSKKQFLMERNFPEVCFQGVYFAISSSKVQYLEFSFAKDHQQDGRLRLGKAFRLLVTEVSPRCIVNTVVCLGFFYHILLIREKFLAGRYGGLILQISP